VVLLTPETHLETIAGVKADLDELL
jgi:hypothetical protein